MTPERTTELAKQANEYADIEYEKHWKSGLFVKEHWQSLRDQRFAELVRNETLEETAKEAIGAGCRSNNVPTYGFIAKQIRGLKK